MRLVACGVAGAEAAEPAGVEARARISSCVVGAGAEVVGCSAHCGVVDKGDGGLTLFFGR